MALFHFFLPFLSSLPFSLSSFYHFETFDGSIRKAAVIDVMVPVARVGADKAFHIPRPLQFLPVYLRAVALPRYISCRQLTSVIYFAGQKYRSAVLEHKSRGQANGSRTKAAPPILAFDIWRDATTSVDISSKEFITVEQGCICRERDPLPLGLKGLRYN